MTLLRKNKLNDQAELLLRGELTKLDFNWCRIGDDGAEIVASFLRYNETVLEVSLRGCSIASRGVKVIAEALKLNETVRILVLKYNEVGDEDTKTLIHALDYNVCIEELLLPYIPCRELEEIVTRIVKFRNGKFVPAAARRASLSLIAARSTISDSGIFAIFPKEIVKMIAMEVWATRNDPIWINALSESERTGK